jgi:hypothetical protein
MSKLAKVEYRSNNSGGSWWLSDDDWKSLEAAGWEVEWCAEDEFQKEYIDDDGRWLGALATSAVRRNVTMREAVEEFERVTGQDASAEGCNCCGQPHYFSGEDADEKSVSGPEIRVSTSLVWGEEDD